MSHRLAELLERSDLHMSRNTNQGDPRSSFNSTAFDSRSSTQEIALMPPLPVQSQAQGTMISQTSHIPRNPSVQEFMARAIWLHPRSRYPRTPQQARVLQEDSGVRRASRTCRAARKLRDQAYGRIVNEASTPGISYRVP